MLKASKYQSQYGQDQIIDKLLDKRQNGFFIDIGAHDGKTYSNSYFFEKNRSYNGLCIEPNPDVYHKLKKNRKCDCINAAISEKNEVVKFTKCTGYAEMLSGITKYREEKHIQRTKKDVSKYGGEIYEIEVNALNLQEVLIEKKNKEIDFLSLDIEGGEFYILKTIDLEKIIIKIIAVELNFIETEIAIKAYLKEHGFILLCKAGSDGIFVNRRSFNTFNRTIVKYLILDRYAHFKVSIAKIIGYNKWRGLLVNG